MQGLRPLTSLLDRLQRPVSEVMGRAEVLRAYVSGFDPQFLGLTGTPEQIKKTAASFKVYYAKTAGVQGNYSMDHSASFYLMDAQGESRVLLSNNIGAAAIAHDIQLLLR